MSDIPYAGGFLDAPVAVHWPSPNDVLFGGGQGLSTSIGYLLGSRTCTKWTNVRFPTTPVHEAAVTSLAYGGSTWVACVNPGIGVFRSTDHGKTWTKTSCPTVGDVVFCKNTAFPNGIFVMGSGSGVTLSPDGASWSALDASMFGPNDVYSTTSTANGLIFIGSGTIPPDTGTEVSYILVSIDGRNWSKSPIFHDLNPLAWSIGGNTSSTQYPTGVTYDKTLSLYCASGYFAPASTIPSVVFTTSHDGYTWGGPTKTFSTFGADQVFGNNPYTRVAGTSNITSGNGTILSSASTTQANVNISIPQVNTCDALVSNDGETWSRITVRTLGPNENQSNMSYVAFSKLANLFVVSIHVQLFPTGALWEIYTSSDGSRWTQANKVKLDSGSPNVGGARCVGLGKLDKAFES